MRESSERTMRIYVADDAMDEETCRRVRAAMDAGVPEPTEVIEDDLTRADEIRRASHIEVDEAVFALIDEHLDAQRDAIAAFFGQPLAMREGVSLLRYEAGGFYKPHVDRADLPAWPPAARRAFTVVLFLASSRDVDVAGGFSGGALRLFPDGEASVDIVPQRGMLVAFPAGTVHEVLPVVDGHRDAIVDWFS